MSTRERDFVLKTTRQGTCERIMCSRPARFTRIHDGYHGMWSELLCRYHGVTFARLNRIEIRMSGL